MTTDLELARKQYDSAHEILTKGDYNTAIQWVEKSANNGLVDAQNDLAYHYLSVEKNPALAMLWMKKVFDNPDYDPNKINEFIPKDVCIEYLRMMEENTKLQEMLANK